MSMKASGGLQSSATATESTDENHGCGECAKLADGFPCADCYINGDAEFTGEFV